MTFTGLLYDLLVAAGVLLAGLGLGWLALAWLRLREAGLLGLWLAWSAGLGLLAWLTMLLGLVGLLRAVLLAPLVLGLACVGAWALVSYAAQRRPKRHWQKTDWPSRLALLALAAFGLASLVWVLLAHSLLPPTDWDAIAYHLELPQLYLEAGRLTYVPYIVTSNWPLGFEMLFSLSLALGSDVAANLLMLGCTALVALGLLAAAQAVLGDGRIGVLAATLFLVVPLVKRLGGVAMIDVAMGLYVLGAAVAFVRWQERRQPAWLLLAGAFCGMAASSKLMGGGVALLFGVLFGWHAATQLWQRQQSKTSPEAAVANSATLAPGQLLQHALIFALAGLAIVGPWYLRSYLNTGNPIWPFGYHLFGGRDWDELGDEYHMQLLIDTWSEVVLARNPIGLLHSFWLILMRPETLGGYRGGLGRVLLLGGLATLALLPAAPRLVRQSLFVSGGFWLLWFFLVSHQVRYLLPVAPLLALASAWACWWALDRVRPRLLRTALLIAVALLPLSSWPWLDAGERGLLAARAPYLRGEQSREAYLEASIDAMPLFRYAEQLPNGSTLLLLPYENRSYYLRRPAIWGNLVAQRVVRFEQQASAEELLATLHQLGITHVIDNPSLVFTAPRYWQHDRNLQLELAARCGEPLFQHGVGQLYALRERCLAAAGGAGE